MWTSEFLKLYEELNKINATSLTEAKADVQKLIDFAGQDLANRFLKIKHRFKSPENDLYYWLKNKTVNELEQAVIELENTSSKYKLKKTNMSDGAQLVNETEHWKIYHITTFEASKIYGRDTKWCITGVNGYGDKYWKNYTEKGITFYFLITKQNYNSRGSNSKFAFAVYPDGYIQIYNQLDTEVYLYQIPYKDEIYIEGLDLTKVIAPQDPDITCDWCGAIINSETDLIGEPFDIKHNGEHVGICAYCLIWFWNKHEHLTDLFIAISSLNISPLNLEALIEKAKLTQEKIDETIEAWVQAKKDGTINDLCNSEEELEWMEEEFINQAARLGFEVSPADLI